MPLEATLCHHSPLSLSLGCCSAPPQPWCSGPGCCQASILTFCVSLRTCAVARWTSLSGVRSGRAGPCCGLELHRSHCPVPASGPDTLRRIRAAGQKTLPLIILGHSLHSSGQRQAGGQAQEAKSRCGASSDSRYRPAPGPRSSALAAWSQVTCLLSVSRPDDKLSLD